ncbi:MAG: amino acid racemase [Actinobacteria bacterium]|nr:amino acid racemase [Actinomycetota bacterium]
MAKLTVGVLGGMGPLATAEFMRLLVAFTPAKRDQEHLHVIVDSNPMIPDRTAALLRGGEDPTPMLVESARLLESAGAEILAMPCNTAHFLLSDIQAAVSIPVLDMIEETIDAIARDHRGTVGIMATAGTVSANLYGRALESRGMSWIAPDDETQGLLNKAIDLVKAGEESRAGPPVEKVVRRLAGSGAGVLVLGCTELPMALRGIDIPVPVVDPMTVLARAVVDAAHSVEASERR